MVMGARMGVEEDNVKGEEAFRNTTVLPWTKQVTLRSVVTSFVLSIVFIFIVMKLNLTTGVIPSLNVAAGLLGFAILKMYMTLLSRCGLLKQPFTRQENTVIQPALLPPLESHSAIGSNALTPVLRPLRLDDFIQSKLKVGPSVAYDAASMNELRKWNEMYGEGGSRKRSPFGFGS